MTPFRQVAHSMQLQVSRRLRNLAVCSGYVWTGHQGFQFRFGDAGNSESYLGSDFCCGKRSGFGQDGRLTAGMLLDYQCQAS